MPHLCIYLYIYLSIHVYTNLSSIYLSFIYYRFLSIVYLPIYQFINHLSSISLSLSVIYLLSPIYYLFIHLSIICISIIHFLPYNNVIYLMSIINTLSLIYLLPTHNLLIYYLSFIYLSIYLLFIDWLMSVCLSIHLSIHVSFGHLSIFCLLTHTQPPSYQLSVF